MDRIERPEKAGLTNVPYLSLYRKWRPRSFQTLIGQEIPVTILVNSLKENQISHAYLFCGPRGVGKTTTARILAMSLNCAGKHGVEPCGECEICRSIQMGSSLDVVEMDAASHRGIDEIRDLRDKVKYVPLHSRYKVYIIDEVHMLTNEAFNALLKTLEEPPRHVVFVLATTEPQRLPDTIVSRCSRINFNRIDLDDTVDQLKTIAQAEGLSIDEDVLYLIARKADGALRDAEGFLEQLAAWGGPIDIRTAARILREVDPENLDELFTTLLSGHPGEAILLMNQWLSNGLSPEELARSLMEYFRALLMAVLVQERNLAGISQHRWDTIRNLVSGLDTMVLKNALKLVQKVLGDMRRSPQPRVLIELAIFDIIELLEVDRRPETTRKSSVQVEHHFRQTLVEQEKITHEAGVVPSTPKGQAEPEAAGNGDELVGAGDRQADWWTTALAKIKQKRISLYAFLQEANPRENGPATITLAFGSDCRFHKESVERPENLRYLTEILEQVKGGTYRLECLIDENLPVRSGSPPMMRETSSEDTGDGRHSRSSTQAADAGGNVQLLLQQTADLFSGLVVHYIAIDDHSKGGWGDAEYEKLDERSPENAG